MITEIRPKGFFQNLSRVLSPGNKSRYLEVPESIDHTFPLGRGSSGILVGPSHRLTSLLIRTGNHIDDLAKYTHREPNFSIERETKNQRVVVDHAADQLIIPASIVHTPQLLYGVINGIARLNLPPTRVGDYLYQWGPLRQIEYKSINNDPTFREYQSSWRKLACEEKQVAFQGLEYIKYLFYAGVNPIPFVTNTEQLTRLVNSPHVLRTDFNLQFNPAIIPGMSVSPEEVEQIIPEELLK